MKRIAIAALSTFFAFATLAGAAERSIDDCEKIAEADAYNRCLARFGPPAKKLGALTRGGVGDARDDGAQDAGVQDAAGAQDVTAQDGAGPADEAPAKAGAHHRGRSRHAHGRRHGGGHVYAHRHGRHAHAAQAGGVKRMAFNTVSNRRTR